MFSNYNLGENFSQSDYTSNHVEGEEFITNTVQGQTALTLAWTPVIPSTLTLTINGQEFTDDGNGTIHYTGNAIAVDYEKGTLTFTNAVNNLQAHPCYCNHNWQRPLSY